MSDADLRRDQREACDFEAQAGVLRERRRRGLVKVYGDLDGVEAAALLGDPASRLALGWEPMMPMTPWAWWLRLREVGFAELLAAAHGALPPHVMTEHWWGVREDYARVAAAAAIAKALEETD